MVHVALLLAGLYVAQVASQSRAVKCGTEEQCNALCEKNWKKGYVCKQYNSKTKSCKGCEDFKCMTRDEVPYRDPITGTMDCCPGGTHFEFDKGLQKGGCCDDGKYLSVNTTFKAVGCCPEGEPKHALFVDPDTGDSSCCEATAIGFSEGQCVMPDGPNPNPPSKKNECGHEICPPNEHDMGLVYGKCYRLISPVTGFPLSVYTSDYRLSETDQDPIWQFRVCHSTTDCSPGGTVKEDEKFTLNDVIGPLGNKDPGPWWICNGAHYAPCKDGKNAKKFTAKKWCTSDGCGICLAADPKGIGRVCPGHQALGDSNNPRQCIPFIVEEMQCLADNPLPEPSLEDYDEEL